MWVARNSDGSLHVWLLTSRAPEQRVFNGVDGEKIIKYAFSIDYGYAIQDTLFPDLTYENGPVEVELIPVLRTTKPSFIK